MLLLSKEYPFCSIDTQHILLCLLPLAAWLNQTGVDTYSILSYGTQTQVNEIPGVFSCVQLHFHSRFMILVNVTLHQKLKPISIWSFKL